MANLLRAIALLFFSNNVVAESFVIGYSDEHLYMDSDILNIAECAFKRSGHKVEFRLLPMERSLRMAARGQIDGDLARVDLSKNQFQDLLPISEPIAEIRLWVYGRSGLNIKDKQSLHQHVMVPVLGVQYFSSFESEGFKISDKAASIVNAFQMISVAHGDYTLWSEGGAHMIEKGELSHTITRYFKEPYDTHQMYTMLHKKHERHLESLRASYQQVMADDKCRMAMK